MSHRVVTTRILPRCKDGCCPSTKPVPTPITILAAAGMAVMLACIAVWVVVGLWQLWTFSPAWFGVMTIPIPILLLGRMLSRRTRGKWADTCLRRLLLTGTVATGLPKHPGFRGFHAEVGYAKATSGYGHLGGCGHGAGGIGRGLRQRGAAALC